MSTAPPMIYLDNAATTRPRPEVVEEVARVMRETFGNPSSRHGVGLRAEIVLRRAREVLAGALGAGPDGITFCSGGTEANAMALLGAVRAGGGGGHVLISAVEHPSLIGCADLLQREGVEVERIPVTPGGWVDPERAAAMARPDTRALCLMLVNNETGVIQPVAEVVRAVKAAAPGCLALVDCVQAFTTVPARLDLLGADVIMVSSHKVHGPRGVGCLAARPGVRLAPLWGGGDQEGGRRPGTENVAGVAGFARAVELAVPAPEEQAGLLARLQEAALEHLPRARTVGDPARRAPHILCVAVPSLPSEVLVNMLEERGVCVSSGSACHSRRSLASHVMKAMGLPAGHGLIRFSLGHLTGRAEVEAAAAAMGALGLKKR